jgi:hypothetical protein
MKQLRGFLRFWRHFIIGDDIVIATVVMWALLFIWSLSSYYINGWLIVPVIVMLLLATLFYNQVTAYPLLRDRPRDFTLLLATGVPMVAVLTVPLLWFRYTTHMTAPYYTLLPVSIYVFIAFIMTYLATFTYRKFPALTVFTFGIVTFALISFYQPAVTEVARVISNQFAFVGWLVALAIPIAFVSWCIVLYQRPLNQSNS